MGHVAGQPAPPEMDLSIHDAPQAPLPSIGIESILSGRVAHGS